MGKGSSKGHTPREAKDNLKSSQMLSVIDAISEGPIEGPVDGLKSVLLNSTPVLDSEGNTNIAGVTVVFRAGEQEQTPPEGFESSGSETVLGTEVKYDTPITRTITSANIDRLRFTFGVQALVETTSKGDRNPSEVRLLVQIQRNGGWVTEKDITIKGKTTSQYLASVVVDNLPPRPFSIRMRRMTPDSTTDQLQNKTLWSSYTEIIDVKQCYLTTQRKAWDVLSDFCSAMRCITESHLGKELLEKVELTENNASKLEEFSKEWKDANDKWNAMWGVKIEQTKDGKHYVAGIGLSMEDTEEGKLSQFLVAANRIAFIDPSNGNTRPMFVGQGDQIFMNDVFLKRLTAPTITSGGNPPAFSLTPDGKLTAKNADISGNVNANSGTLNNVTINENCQIKGKLSANQIEGDIVKTVSKSFPRTNSYASGTITVRISDDQKFDRQVMIPPVLFRGGKHENFNSNNQQSYWYSTCRLRVTRNGQEIFKQSTTDAQGVFSSVIDMPAGQGTLTLTFTVSSSGANNWTPTTSISDLLVVVMKKSTAGISIS